MKPFNLELALAGHPLITRSGEHPCEFIVRSKSTPFDLSTGSITAYPYISIIEDNAITYTKNGRKYVNGNDCDLDLFLDDSIPWDREPKIGDKIMVRNTMIEGWVERIFIKKGKDKTVICVDYNYEKYYIEGDVFKVAKWHDWKFPETKNITVDIKIDGKSIKATNITEKDGVINISANIE